MADKKRLAPKRSSSNVTVPPNQKTLYDLFPRKARELTQTLPNLEAIQVNFCPTPTVDENLEDGIPQTRAKPPAFSSSKPIDLTNFGIDEDELTIIEPLHSHTGHDVRQPQIHGRTRQTPIIIDSSPLKSAPHIIKPVHSFFTSNPNRRKASTKTRPSNATVSTPYPDKTSQHVKGHQTTPLVYPSQINRKLPSGPAVEQPSLEDLNFLKLNFDHKPQVDPAQCFSEVGLATDEYLHSIPECHLREYPAIRRAVDSFHNRDDMPQSTASRRPWVNKWYPRCTQEVLGNESSALYLRDWLSALQLQFLTTQAISEGSAQGSQEQPKSQLDKKKRPNIVREVDRRRKKRRIYSDDEKEAEWIDYSDLLLPEELDDNSKSQQNPPVTTGSHTFEQLHNTILLTGPCGSGKTSSVYACAEELGWEVFEVYPGIGRRSGSNVDLFVGAAGKNHIVHTASTREDATLNLNPVSPGFPRTKTEEPSDVYDITVEGDSSKLHVQPLSIEIADGQRPFRQSLILLEEVDILFKEDINFWPWVIQFIKQCKRPVICTCNDPSIVPVMDLPLQATLTMNSCPPPVAVSYLQALCNAEGYLVPRNDLSRLYNQTRPVPLIEASNIYVTTDVPPVPDLRRTINILELWCSTNVRNRPDCTVPWEDNDLVGSSSNHPRPVQFNKLADDNFGHSRMTAGSVVPTSESKRQLPESIIEHEAEFLSFADSELTRKPAYATEILQFADLKSSDDDELGYTILYDSMPTHGRFSLCDRDEQIISAGVHTARGLGMIADRRLDYIEESKLQNIGRLVDTVLGEVCSRAKSSVSRVSLHVDYMPWIRQIIATDDKDEEIYLSRARSGRMTRNSGGEYVRAVILSDSGRDALEASAYENWGN